MYSYCSGLSYYFFHILIHIGRSDAKKPYGLFDIAQIHLYEITINRHFSKIYTLIQDADFLFPVTNQLSFPRCSKEMKLHRSVIHGYISLQGQISGAFLSGTGTGAVFTFSCCSFIFSITEAFVSAAISS